jgi:hypothetical protein
MIDVIRLRWNGRKSAKRPAGSSANLGKGKSKAAAPILSDKQRGPVCGTM